jgi:hypothetical protein
MPEKSIDVDSLWTRPEDGPRFAWVGCRNKHLRHVYATQLAGPIDCDICYEPMRTLSDRTLAAYKRFNRLCWHCRAGNHNLCTGVACYGCDHGKAAYLTGV